MKIFEDLNNSITVVKNCNEQITTYTKLIAKLESEKKEMLYPKMTDFSFMGVIYKELSDMYKSVCIPSIKRYKLTDYFCYIIAVLYFPSYYLGEDALPKGVHKYIEDNFGISHHTFYSKVNNSKVWRAQYPDYQENCEKILNKIFKKHGIK